MSDNQIVNEVNADMQEQVNSSNDGDTATATTNPPAGNGDGYKETPHDDFDWTIDKRNVSAYGDAEKKKYDEVYEGTFKAVSDGELVTGTVVALTKTDVVINIG